MQQDNRTPKEKLKDFTSEQIEDKFIDGAKMEIQLQRAILSKLDEILEELKTLNSKSP